MLLFLVLSCYPLIAPVNATTPAESASSVSRGTPVPSQTAIPSLVDVGPVPLSAGPQEPKASGPATISALAPLAKSAGSLVLPETQSAGVSSIGGVAPGSEAFNVQSQLQTGGTTVPPQFPSAQGQQNFGSPWVSVGPNPIATSVFPNGSQRFNWGSPPFSGRVNAIAVNGSNPSDVYVGTATGGIWKSMDGGSTWSPMALPVSSPAVSSIVITPDGGTIYVGTGDANYPNEFSAVGSGILESTDGGRSWSVLGESAFQGLAISSILVNPSEPSQLMVSATASGCCGIGHSSVPSASQPGIYLSTDGGASWTPLMQGSMGVAGMSLVEDSRSGGTSYIPVAGDFQGVLWAYYTAAYAGGSLETSWASGSWSKLLWNTDPNCTAQGNDNCRVATTFSPANQGMAYAVFGNSTGQLLAVANCDISTEACTFPNIPQPTIDQTGSTQGPCGVGQSGYDLFIAVDPNNADLMYLACTTLYRSIDGGATWQPLGGYVQGSVLHPDFHAFAFSPGSGTIYVGNDGGIWSSSDQGSTWTDLNTGLSTIEFYSIAVSPSGGLLGGSQDNGCEATGGSLAWNNVATGDGGWVGFAPDNPNIVYCLADGSPLVSTDGGTTFNLGSGIEPSCFQQLLQEPIAQDPNNPGTLYWAAGGCLYKTTDYMQSWTLIGRDNVPVTSIAVAPSDSRTVYVGDYGGYVSQSQNGGFSWATAFTISVNGGAVPIDSVVVNPSDPNDVVASAASYLQPTLVEDKDGSLSQFPTAGLPSSNVDVLQFFGSDFYAGTDSGGVYYLPSSGGTSWSSVGQGLTTSPVYDLAMSNGLLYAGTYGRGAWVTCLDCVSQTFSYSVSGGQGYSAPSLNYSYAGRTLTAALSTTPTQYSMDPSSTWSVSLVLPGSSSSERWATPGPVSGAATSAATVVLPYYHQYALQLNISVADGGSPAPPTLTAQDFGQATSIGAPFGLSSAWVDAGSTWSLSSALNGTAGERWSASTSTGTMGQAATVPVTYTHQYLVAVSVAQGSGTLAVSTGWHDVGSTVSLGASPSPGWAFGVWVGNGSSSYSGNQTAPSITVNSPVEEGADFYPGVTIVASGSGSVGYAYGGRTGTVSSGQSEVVFVPLGTSVGLTSHPSSILYQFNGWSGAASGSSGSTTVEASSPVSVQASFGYDFVNIGGIAGAAVMAIGVAFYFLRMRHSVPLPPPPPDHTLNTPPPPSQTLTGVEL